MRRIGLACLAALWFAAPLAAEPDKFSVDGDRLRYDTENVPEEVEKSIENDDVDVLFDLLQANPDIRVLELNSSGGSVWAAQQMSNIIVDLEIDTHVNGRCESVCTVLLMAGVKRTMSRGSRIGFHQTWWSPGGIEEYYGSEAESEGWNTPFEFASWLYGDAQNDVHELLIYMVRRGVDPVFAIETLKVSADSMWRPYRPRLLAAGILTE